MFIRLLTILLATSVLVKTENLKQISDVCDISSDFIHSLFVGLINNYKYEEVATTSELIKKVYENIDDFDKKFTEALDNDYDDYVLEFGFYTTEIENGMLKALNKTDEMNADMDHKVVREISFSIKAERYDEAVTQMGSLENEILIYKIVESAYKSERQVHAFNKLLKFSYKLLNSRNMSLVIAVEVSLFKELTEDPNNLYTRQMISFAELVRETIETYYEYYRDTSEYNEMNNRLNYIQVSFPENIQRLVFLKGFEFSSFMCFRNVYWKERMFVGDFQYGNDHNRRILYISDEGVDLPNQQWNIYYNSTKQGYIIRSALYDEYLHNAEDAILLDNDNRFVFTKPKQTDPLKGYWALIPIDVNYFAIKNVYDDEFIYAVKDETFVKEYHKRRVFSWRVKGDFKSPQYKSELWTLEVC